MSNLDSARSAETAVSRPLAVVIALVIAVCVLGGAALLWYAANRPDRSVAIIEWVDPVRVQASVVERTVVDTDRLLRLFVMQGRANDGTAYEARRLEAGKAVDELASMSEDASPEVNSAAGAMVTSVKKWLEFADDWFAAAHGASEDSGRVAVMMRMGPEDPLADMIKERKALDDALAKARADLLDPSAGSKLTSAPAIGGIALLFLAVALAAFLAMRGGGGGKGAKGAVDADLVRAVLDLIPDGVAIFDEHGDVIVANLTASRSIDPSRPVPDRIALYGADGSPFPETDSPLGRALGGHHVHEQNVHSVRLDGSLSPVDVHAEPVITDGRASAAVVVIRDKSEERRVEEELNSVVARADHAEANLADLARQLRASDAQLQEARSSLEKAEQRVESPTERFARIFSGADVIGAAIFSAGDLELLDANDEGLAMLGERRGIRDIRGSLLVEIVPGAATSGLLDIFRRVVTTAEPFASREYHAEGLRAGDGYWRFAVVPGASRPGAAVDHVIFVGVDITAEVEARAVQAVSSEPVSSTAWSVEDVLLAISNDLRTPILSIQGMVGLFRAKYAEAVPDVTALHYLELTQKNADQIATLIDELVELSGLGHSDMEPTEIPLAAAIEEAWRSSPRTGIELRVAGPLPTVRASRSKLLRAFKDMFDVAARHRRAGEGAWMHVKVRDLGAHWEIELTDNGTGFAPNEVESLFGPLAQSVAHASNNGGPTLVASGLGLAAVRRIAELHGGAASVRSTLGEGTVYSFTIAK